MRDGPVRAVVKLVSRGAFTAFVGLSRLRARARGEERWMLGGACERCASCCEEPSIRVDRVTWFLPLLRRAFLLWQRVVNGFELVSSDRRARTFTFRCTHFDTKARRCDSYATRPGICRDYPRALLAQAWPEFLDGCGHRAVAKNGEAMLVQLRARGLPERTVDELAKRMRLR